MKIATVMLAALLTAAGAQAADNPAGINTGISPDAAVVQQLAIGGTTEVAAGKIATTRAQNPKVKEFGQTMVTDHSKANEKLLSLAKTKNINVQAKPDSAKLADLEKLSGNAFDKKYIDSHVESHQKTSQLLRTEIDTGKDADVRKLASEMLPVVTHHLEMAKQIQASLSGSGTRAPSEKVPGDKAPGKAGTY